MRHTAILVTLLGYSFLAAAEGKHEKPDVAASEDQVAEYARWYQELGAEEYKAREAAVEKFVKEGKKAAAWLKKQPPSEDAEVQLRTKLILERIAGADLAGFARLAARALADGEVEAFAQKYAMAEFHCPGITVKEGNKTATRRHANMVMINGVPENRVAEEAKQIAEALKKDFVGAKITSAEKVEQAPEVAGASTAVAGGGGPVVVFQWGAQEIIVGGGAVREKGAEKPKDVEHVKLVFDPGTGDTAELYLSCRKTKEEGYRVFAGALVINKKPKAEKAADL